MSRVMFVGIDPSLSSTGLYIDIKSGKDIVENKFVQIDTKPSMFPNSINRCLYIADVIMDVINEMSFKSDQIGLIVCEDYFVGRQPGTVIQLAELGTLIRYRILLKKYPICVVPPKTIKKFVTDNGNAKKQQMIQTVFDRWGFKAKTDNLADACGMAKFSEFVYSMWNGIIKPSVQELKIFGAYSTTKCLINID